MNRRSVLGAAIGGASLVMAMDNVRRGASARACDLQSLRRQLRRLRQRVQEAYGLTAAPLVRLYPPAAHFPDIRCALIRFEHP